MITKEILNKNRVLTMSNNRKCNYLIVDVGNNSETIMMGINIQDNRKDIIVIKRLVNKSYEDLVDEAIWLCNEFNIKIVLADKNGYGLRFIDMFELNINPSSIQIREIDGFKNVKYINDILNDLKCGMLRFLQTPELALSSYIKPFLGLSNVMEYHKETDKLIDELSNIELGVNKGNISLKLKDDNIGRLRVNCLLMFYFYPMNLIEHDKFIYEYGKNSNNDVQKKKYDYETIKRIAQYEIIHGTFYKYLFKCIENEKINVIFYCGRKGKTEQFRNMVNEDIFINLIKNHTIRINLSKDYFEIIFNNDSCIRFIYASYNARGYKYHFAVVDTEIDREMYNNVICGKTILFNMSKRDGKLEEDNYCVEFVEM